MKKQVFKGWKKQKGLSPIGVMFLICIFAMALLLVLKLVPHYIEYNTIRGTLNDIVEMPEMRGASLNDIHDRLGKLLLINSVRDFNYRKNTYISVANGYPEIVLDYKVKEHIIGNADVLLTFYYTVEAPQK